MNITAEGSPLQTAAYLRTLPAVRDRCGQVFELAKAGRLNYFDYHPEREQDVTDFCINLMKRDFGSDFSKIPPHGRWRHFNRGRERIEPLIASSAASLIGLDRKETCKMLIDLFVVSVLLDAGAGKHWKYTEPGSEAQYDRSEGLAICSLDMFKNGAFSSAAEKPCQVDAPGLSQITAESLGKHMQVSESNPLVGVEGRAALLSNLGIALTSRPDFFAGGRPGGMLDFLESQSIEKDGRRQVPLAALWSVLIDGLNPVWPSTRTALAGIALGDVWPCPSLGSGADGQNLVPFHKLTQWMTYSLIEAISSTMKWTFAGIEDMTGLPEYRNGGLLVDLKVLSLKPNALPIHEGSGLPCAPASHPAIVEWRALTVIMLDRLAASIRTSLSLKDAELSLAQVLESASWKGGREIAKQLRPATGGPPIEIESDGTIF